MTQEEKELLIKDLCERLPYGVKCCDFCYDDEGDIVNTIETLECIYPSTVEYKYKDIDAKHNIERIKPYLRSLSNMTEKEKEELSKKYVWNIWSEQIQIRYHSQGCWDDETECPTEEYIDLFDWLKEHHFDYRGLIKKGLALEAPKNMYVF